MNPGRGGTNRPPVEGCRETSPRAVENVDNSSCAKYAARSIQRHYSINKDPPEEGILEYRIRCLRGDIVTLFKVQGTLRWECLGPREKIAPHKCVSLEIDRRQARNLIRLQAVAGHLCHTRHYNTNLKKQIFVSC